MPAVSIVVPVCNVERYLDECLASIEAQTLHDIQIICVNDGSKDSSLEILQRHAAFDARIEIIDKPNAGYGHTINRGIAAATGEYLGIVESDDFVEPQMFERLYGAAKNADLDIVRANYWLYWSAPEPRDQLVECYPADVCGAVFNPRELARCFYFPPALWAMLVRRSMVVEHGLKLLETPGASYQDTAFSFKLWSCARRAMLLSEPYLHYRQDNESSSINNKGKAYYVCGEYAEIERFVRDAACDPTLMPIAQKRKFDAYLWNMGRIGEDLRPEFARAAAEEFRRARDAGELNECQFDHDGWHRIRAWMENPELFAMTFDAPVPQDDVPKPGLLRRILHKIRG